MRNLKNQNKEKRTRKTRLYPALSFEEALQLGEAIHERASGEKVNRLTPFKAINKSPTSSSGVTLITASSKYGITTGSYAAEYLELTEQGRISSDPAAQQTIKIRARFELAIHYVPPFKALYTKYKGKKLPAHDVMADTLKESGFEIDNTKECIDIFVVNCKFLGLLQTIAGSETLLQIEAILDEAAKTGNTSTPATSATLISTSGTPPKKADKIKWETTCFYITPIGEEGTELRKHSDLFLNSLIEPALKEIKLDVIRADKIGEQGMISTQILEHIINARLVIVDLSYHNPNVFYEMAIRHACKLPIVQICRKEDKLPFDVNQVRTVVIDTSDIYTLIPKLDTYRAEIATHVRSALEGQQTSNPITVFLPHYGFSLQKNTAKVG